MVKRLKLKHNIPFYLEQKLIHKLGYVVEKRIPQDSIWFIQRSVMRGPIAANKNIVAAAAPVVQIGMLRQAELMRRCDNIADFFPDPYNQAKAIRQRLHNMAQTLPSLQERQFVLDFMDDQFPLEDTGD